jgi:hypothetical protein
MIVAPIPIYGRLPLVKLTIQRLQDQGAHVIGIGHEKQAKDLVLSMGAEWVEHSNDPLGAKWNAGFKAAKKHNPSGVIFMGSSDWCSDNYIETCELLLDEYDLLGKLGCHFIDVAEDIRLVNWHGYGTGPRSYEPIGIGRVLSDRFLNKLNWQPFDQRLSSGLDWSMWLKAIYADAAVGILEDPDLMLMSISTSAWNNKHKFNDHWTGPLKSERITDLSTIYKTFPQITELHETMLDITKP